MGLMVYILNEYRMDQKTESNKGLRHVTVLEEAHNLLKNSKGTDSQIVGKSVEMLTNTIAEIRTYGEGFIIVDQSPSSVDIAAIKNTNTKIVLRTPEANDREAVGRSMGLTNDQVNEIAKLPGGVAVVYQNNWITPVLTMIDKADVREVAYQIDTAESIMPVKIARTKLIRMIMQPWLQTQRMHESVLRDSLRALDISREDRKAISALISDYSLFCGRIAWKREEIPQLQRMLRSVLGFTDKDIEKMDTAEKLKNQMVSRFRSMQPDQIEMICYILTLKGESVHESV